MSRAPAPEPTVETGPTDVTPGVSIRQSPILGADIYLDGAKSLTQLHATAIEAGLEDSIHDVLRALPGSTHTEWRQIIDEVLRQDDRVDGDRDADESDVAPALASALAKAATVLRDDSDDDDNREDTLDDARRALTLLGRGHVDNIPTSRADCHATTALLQEAGDAIPARTIEVHLGVEWAGQRADQRRDVVEWLSELWTVHDVQLVVSRAAAGRLVDAHRDQLPAHLTQQCKRRLTPAIPESSSQSRVGEADGGAGRTSERARLARDELSADSRKTAVVANVAADADHALTYGELADALVLDSPSDGNLYQVVKRLEEGHGLVERVDRPDGHTIVSLTPAGLTYIQDVYKEEGVQSRLPGTVAGVSQTPQNSPPMPCKPAQAREAPPGTAAEDRPGGEGAAAATPEGPAGVEDWTHGLVAPEFMGYDRALPAEAAAERGDVVLQNSRIQREDVDPRQPRVSVRGSTLVVEAGKAENPLQHATTIAHGLGWEATRNQALTASDIDTVLDGDLDVEQLRDATGVGWLGDEDDGADVAESIDEALATMLYECGALQEGDHDVIDRLDTDDGFSNEGLLEHIDGLEDGSMRELTASEHRSLITRFALGLSTTIVHLLDLSGMDVVLNVRIPECSRHFSADDDENDQRRQTMLEHLTTIASLWSRYGAWNGFKQLHETRPAKRSSGDPEVDATDPIGKMRASIVVIGRGVQDLADELRDALEDDRNVVDDAPEINVAVGVQEGTDLEATRKTARWMLREEKNMRPTHGATAALVAFAADPWAVAEAIHWGLQHETSSRKIHLDEVRRALSQLHWNRLLEEPETATSTKRKALAVLLEADAPISAAEMQRRDGPSPESWRHHRDRLIELGLVEETPAGWRLTLPFGHERGAEAVEACPEDRDEGERPSIPWHWQADGTDVPGDLGGDKRSPGDVIDWLLIERGLIEDASRIHDPDDPVGKWADAYYGAEDPDWSAMRDVCREFEIPWRLLAAGCGLREPSPPSHTAAVGPELAQTPLSTDSASYTAD